MSVTSVPSRARPLPGGGAWAEAALVSLGLGAVVFARAVATRSGVDPILVGSGFGVALLGLVAVGGVRVEASRHPLRAALAGVAVGVALVGAVTVGEHAMGSSVVPGLGRAASPFLPWATVTIMVSAGEEAVLRGILFDRLRRAGGTLTALLASTVLFALLHVPLYGWHVVPLDLAVGLALGGLRVATGGIVAPAFAHTVADLATWWL